MEALLTRRILGNMAPSHGDSGARQAAPAQKEKQTCEERGPMMTDRVIFVCTIIIAAVYLYATTLIPSLEIGDPLGPKAFPRLLGIVLLIAAGLLFLEIWKERKQPKPAPGEELAIWRYAGVIIAVTVWTGIYYAAFDKLGYIISTTVYLVALMAWFNRGKWVANVLTAVLFSLLSYIMFVKLDVNLPRGVEAVTGLSEAVVKVTDAIVGVFKPIIGWFK
jgi:putative tricarboxylic transport membrane protein